MELRALLGRIADLQARLKQREDFIEEMTKGYMKDITHMKEMIFRKKNKDQLDFFEVQYFDGTHGLSEET